MRKFTYINCPVCGKEFQSLGYASHMAMHRRQREKAAKKLQQADVIKSVCHEPTIHCELFLNHGFAACEQCQNYY